GISVVQFFDVVLNKSCLPRFYRKTKYLVDSILSHSHTFGALRYRSCKDRTKEDSKLLAVALMRSL
ncbi:MAG: hypothetical protein ACKOQS_06470, partial [Dolichospermum sp.]